MLITSQVLTALQTGWNASFNQGFGEAESFYDKLAMVTNSGGAEEVYAWLAQLPQIREWLGDRVIHELAVHGYKIENREFESTVAVKRTDIEDDRIGVYGPMFREIGRRTAEHPDVLLAELIKAGFTSMCYDGQNFFDTDHPVFDNGIEVSKSNLQEGDGAPWYILDLSRALRPFIFQQRKKFEMTSLDKMDDPNVFFKGEYLYGVRGRSNVGFGLWQLAYASRAPLNPENYAAARRYMTTLRGDNGQQLGLRPTHLLIPYELEREGRKLIKNELAGGGESNEWVDSAELIVSPWL